MTAIEFKFYYMFSVKLEFESKRIGESPSGHLVDVTLKPQKHEVYTDPLLFEGSWEALPFTKLSASEHGRTGEHLENEHHPTLEEAETYEDWDGLKGDVINWHDWVLERPDEVTEFNGRATIRAEDHCLIGVVFSGCVDRRRRSDDDGSLDLQMAVRFEGGRNPPKWADPRYAAQKQQWKYKRLFRDQFIGRGKLRPDDRGLLGSAVLNIWGPGSSGFSLIPCDISTVGGV